MNHLLHQITWHQYLTAAFIIASIYYLTIILRCYQPELKNLKKRITGEKSGQTIQALQYQATGEEIVTKTTAIQTPNEHPGQDQSINDTDILGGKLKACIIKAADKPFAPVILIPQLKMILKENQHITASERPAISQLIVNECEKTGTAMLTEEEVDQWWDS